MSWMGAKGYWKPIPKLVPGLKGTEPVFRSEQRCDKGSWGLRGAMCCGKVGAEGTWVMRRWKGTQALRGPNTKGNQSPKGSHEQVDAKNQYIPRANFANGQWLQQPRGAEGQSKQRSVSSQGPRAKYLLIWLLLFSFVFLFFVILVILLLAQKQDYYLILIPLQFFSSILSWKVQDLSRWLLFLEIQCYSKI